MLTQPKRKPGRSVTNSTTKGLLSQLRELAYAKGPDAKLPTTEDLCASYKTSKATLNTVLKTLEGQNIITRRQGSGIFVSPRIHRKSIAVVVNSKLIGAHASPFWGSLLSEFAALAETRSQTADQDFEFFVTTPSPDPYAMLPEQVKRAVREGSIHGVIGLALHIDAVDWLLDHGVPCCAYAGWSKWIVVTGNESFIQTGLQALVDQGCRNVEYWGIMREVDSSSEWYEQTCKIVTDACAAIGIEPPHPLVGPAEDLLDTSEIPSEDQKSPYRAHAAIKALFTNPTRPRPDGIFVGEDTMTGGLLLGLKELGIRPGEDIKIAAQANKTSPILFGTKQNITLLEYDSAEIADALVRLLDQVIADPDLPETRICVPWRIRMPDGLS